MARITGIGGVFLRARSDEKALAAWYVEHLGLQLEPWGGALLKWPEDPASASGVTVWHLASKDSSWFAPSTGSFMINYRVDDMDGVVRRLQRGGVAIFKGPERSAEGTFLWIVDPDGNKVELWQPLAAGTSKKPKARARPRRSTSQATPAKGKTTRPKAGKARAKARKGRR